jgi:hypothetical protein
MGRLRHRDRGREPAIALGEVKHGSTTYGASATKFAGARHELQSRDAARADHLTALFELTNRSDKTGQSFQVISNAAQLRGGPLSAHGRIAFTCLYLSRAVTGV